MLRGMLNDIFPAPNLRLRLSRLGQQTVEGYGYSVMAMAGVPGVLIRVVRRLALAVSTIVSGIETIYMIQVATNQVERACWG